MNSPWRYKDERIMFVVNCVKVLRAYMDSIYELRWYRAQAIFRGLLFYIIRRRLCDLIISHGKEWQQYWDEHGHFYTDVQIQNLSFML